MVKNVENLEQGEQRENRDRCVQVCSFSSCFMCRLLFTNSLVHEECLEMRVSLMKDEYISKVEVVLPPWCLCVFIYSIINFPFVVAIIGYLL